MEDQLLIFANDAKNGYIIYSLESASFQAHYCSLYYLQITLIVIASLACNDAILIAVGVIGAAVMPHALFVHSWLTKNKAQINLWNKGIKCANFI